MRVDWHGQSAFTLDGEGATVFIDPWGDMAAAASRGACACEERNHEWS